MDLKELYSRLYVKTGSYLWPENTTISEEEWQQIQELDNVVFGLCGSTPGLGGVALYILDPPIIPEDKPDLLCVVAGKHLPGAQDLRGTTLIEYALERFSPLLFTIRNVDLREWIGYTPPKANVEDWTY